MRKISAIADLKQAIILTAIFSCLMTTTFGQTKTGYAQVNGIKMYYEIHGAGKPLVLLHGAFNTINTAISKNISAVSFKKF